MKYAVAVFFLFLVVNLNAQDYRKRLFSEVDNVKSKAEKINAELLSPEFFSEALDNYKDAEKSLENGDELEDIRLDIGKAILFFNRSIESSENAERILANTLKARDDARKAEADELAEKKWRKAEKKFYKAAVEIESSDSADAEEYGFEAEKIYRQAELEAIKINYLGNVWDLIKEADKLNVDDYAPGLLDYAEKQIGFAEKELEENRYDNDYARELAADALSETKHAMNITELLKSFDEDDKTREDLILYYEKPLKEIADKFEVPPKFDDGYRQITDNILDKAEKYYSLKEENSALRDELADCKNKMKKFAEENDKLKSQLGNIENFEGRYESVKKLFKKNEAKVIRTEGKIIIRLTSLKFSTGSAALSPKYFGLLTKVEKAINAFPGSRVIVEGHTDSDGKSDKNLELSQKRADAVFQYLFANLDISRDKIYAVGYGETRPIASNKTDSGKMKNRRIDIVIRR